MSARRHNPNKICTQWHSESGRVQETSERGWMSALVPKGWYSVCTLCHTKNIHFLNQKYYVLKIFTNNHPHQSLLRTLHGAQTCPKRYTDALKLHLLLECTSIFPLHFTFPPMKKQNKKTVIWGKTPNIKERVEHANHVSGDKNLHWNISLGSTSNLHFLQIHIVHTL